MRDTNNSKKQDIKYSLVLIAVLLVVALISVYLAFFAPKTLLSPEAGTMSYENARSLLSDLGQEGIDWYCGKISEFTDKQGNLYNQKSLEELKKILGNEEQLRREFCN